VKRTARGLLTAYPNGEPISERDLTKAGKTNIGKAILIFRLRKLKIIIFSLLLGQFNLILTVNMDKGKKAQAEIRTIEIWVKIQSGHAVA
jgi:hypothetical protein